MFPIEIHTADWVLIAMLSVLFIAQVYFYARYMAAPARKMRKKSSAPSLQDGEEEPAVSVILCARNEGDNLTNYLSALLTQDYPTYEVIVVNDGSEDNTRDVIEDYMLRYPHLRTTFVPLGARVRSTKKLALTLGAKAARYDYLLMTDADCVPESSQWIREMVKGFGKVPSDKGPSDQVPSDQVPSTKDIVLGFGAYFAEKGHVNRLVRYDTLFNGLHYLGAALCGHPYMGVGRNLAYRKSLFFESGGFTHLMTSSAGDDDLFVNHTATGENTTVVLSRESITWSPAKKTMKEWWQQKRRHLSVSPSYRRDTQWRLVIEPVIRGLFYAAILAAVIYSLRTLNFLPLYIALVLFLTRWLLQTLILNVSARRMGVHGFQPQSVLWFDIVLPLVNLWMLATPKRKIKW